MLGDGSKVEHIEARNFISEMVDSFNVSAIQTGSGAKISIVVGRDTLSVRQETLVAQDGAFSAQVLPEDMILRRLVVANLSIPLENAKQLIVALQTAVGQVETMTAHGAPNIQH